MPKLPELSLDLSNTTPQCTTDAVKDYAYNLFKAKAHLTYFVTLTIAEYVHDQRRWCGSYLRLFLMFLDRLPFRNMFWSAEETLSGQLHFHGIISFDDEKEIKKIGKYWNKKYGFCKIMPVRKLENCSHYVSKDCINSPLIEAVGCKFIDGTNYRSVLRQCIYLNNDYKNYDRDYLKEVDTNCIVGLTQKQRGEIWTRKLEALAGKYMNELLEKQREADILNAVDAKELFRRHIHGDYDYADDDDYSE